MIENREDRQFDQKITFRLFQEEAHDLAIIMSLDEEIKDTSHALRIALKQYINRRRRELEAQGQNYVWSDMYG